MRDQTGALNGSPGFKENTINIAYLNDISRETYDIW